MRFAANGRPRVTSRGAACIRLRSAAARYRGLLCALLATMVLSDATGSVCVSLMNAKKSCLFMETRFHSITGGLHFGVEVAKDGIWAPALMRFVVNHSATFGAAIHRKRADFTTRQSRRGFDVCADVGIGICLLLCFPHDPAELADALAFCRDTLGHHGAKRIGCRPTVRAEHTELTCIIVVS